MNPGRAAAATIRRVTKPDPVALLRSRSYLMLLGFAAVLGIPISAAAYGFLALVSYLQKEIFTRLPQALGFTAEPMWWPLPVLFVGAIAAGLAINLPARRRRAVACLRLSPASPPTAAHCLGVVLAALATLTFGMVLGPEMPLILLAAVLRSSPAR